MNDITIDKLIETYNKIPDECWKVATEDDELFRYGHFCLDEHSDELEGMCCEVFINEYGHPNYENMHKLPEGYGVHPGEVDSFGWLTGIFYGPKGAIVYG